MKYLTQNKHWNIIEDYNIDKLLYLLIDRCDEINFYNDFIWRNVNNKDHRDYDLPAHIISQNVHLSGFDGTFWCKNNHLDRERSKPAVIHNNGVIEYWINSNFVRKEQ